MQLRPGEIVMGRYRIARELATGGMGVVYLARVEGAAGFTRPAVIKRILPELSADDEVVQMFVREARILADLSHPNIVSVLDFASEGRSHLMALEYVHGYSVAHWAKYLAKMGRSIPPPLAAWIVVCVLDALHYAHTRTDVAGNSLGIVHRDISPSNVLLDLEGHVRLVDFGVARVMGETTTNPKDGEVAVRGKFPYMSPELLSGSPPSAKSDLYACGVMLHELLLGKNELRTRDANTTIRNVFFHQLSKLSGEREDVPARLDEVIARATAKELAQRYESAGQMADALRAVLPAGEGQLKAALRTRLRKDFLGEMPETISAPRLEVLESSWKNVPGDPLLSEDVGTPRRISDNPTEPARVAVPKRWPWLLIAVIAFLLASVAALAIFVVSQTRTSPQQVVVVERQLGDEPREEAPREEAPASEPDPTSAAVPATPRPRRFAQGTAAQLTNSFNQQNRRLSSCFRQHGQTLEGRPALSIRFHIHASGRVDRAELMPAEVASTPLGRCLEQVAASTDFGPQPDAVSFRIPIGVRGQ